MKRAISLSAILIFLLPALPQAAYAERGERDWRGGDIRNFGEHDLHRWRDGRWFHGRHDGRRGWWWIAAGAWYFYPGPVYPYPDPYVPPVVVEPAPVVVQPPQAAPQYWYYCDQSGSYYPYVDSCASGWRQVPATPPATLR